MNFEFFIWKLPWSSASKSNLRYFGYTYTTYKPTLASVQKRALQHKHTICNIHHDHPNMLYMCLQQNTRASNMSKNVGNLKNNLTFIWSTDVDVSGSWDPVRSWIEQPPNHLPPRSMITLTSSTRHHPKRGDRQTRA